MYLIGDGTWKNTLTPHFRLAIWKNLEKAGWTNWVLFLNDTVNFAYKVFKNVIVQTQRNGAS